MGEDPSAIHLTGCPAMDLLKETNLRLPKHIFEKYKGVGPAINPQKPYVVVLQHPVTTEYGLGLFQINETLKAVSRLRNKKIQVVWLWPNVDAGSDDVSKGLRQFREKQKPDYMHFFKNFTPEDYARLINNALCLIGNSSSGLREGSFLGVPCVNIGTRQEGREKSVNVIDVGYKEKEIYAAIIKQINHGKYEPSKLFGDGRAGRKIARLLASVELTINKKLNYI